MRGGGAHRESLYTKWRREHIAGIVEQANYWLVVGVIICAAFDPLFFNSINLYTPLRFLPLSLGVVAIGLLKSIKKAKRKTYQSFYPLLLVLPFLTLNITYQYYLLIAPESHLNTVVMGNVLILLIPSLVFHRFFLELIGILAGSAISSLYFLMKYPDLQSPILLVQITIIALVPGAFLLHRSFRKSLEKERDLMAMLLPGREAEAIVTMENVESWSQVFESRHRYCGCIIADWRGYQGMISTVEPKRVEECFNILYGTILENLKRIVPSGTFYANWAADEIFIVIYDDLDRKEEVDRMTASLSLAMVSDIFNGVIPLLGFPVIYDVGATASVGWLGLQGPDGMKKTTLTSRHAGVTKRLQTAGKDLRLKLSQTINHPILLVDEVISQAVDKLSASQTVFRGKIDFAVRDVESNEVIIAYCEEPILGFQSLSPSKSDKKA